MKIDNVEEVEDFLKELRYFFENIEKVNSQLKLELSNKNAEQEDLLHEIELSKLNAVEIVKTHTRLRKTRKERRIIKDKLEFLSTIKGFTDKYNNNLKIYSDLGTVFKNINNLKKNWETRKYTPRILQDLKLSKKMEG